MKTLRVGLGALAHPSSGSCGHDIANVRSRQRAPARQTHRGWQRESGL